MTMTSRAILAVLALAAIPAFASPIPRNVVPGLPAQPDPFTITFDESGKGTTCIFGGSCFATPSSVGVDLNTELVTLLYQLPEIVTSGGINVLDPQGGISDALDFFTNPNLGVSFLAYYSTDNLGTLADGHAGIDFGVVGARENGNGSFTFQAGNGNPSITNFYDGVSDVPEPASIGLLGAGLVLLGSLRRRRRA